MQKSLSIEHLLGEAGWLQRLAASLVQDASTADDLVQDAWVSALRHPPGASRPRPWLARVLHNRARNTRRSQARRARHEELAHDPRVDPGPVDLAQQAEVQRLIAEAVTRLAEPLRDAVVLRYFQGLDSSAAAQRLGVPASTLRTRLQRALEELRADLDRRFGGERRSWALLLAPFTRTAHVGPAGAGAGVLASGWAVWAAGVAAVAVLGFAGVRALGGSPQEEEARVAITGPGIPGGTTEGESAGEQGSGLVGGEREPVESAPSGTEALPAQVLRLPPTSEVAGTIRVDGRPPEWALELTLEETRPPDEPTSGNRLRRLSRNVVRLEPSEHGRFRFNVPVTWSGHLLVDPDHFSGGGNVLELDGPRSGLELDLDSCPAVVGRLLGADGLPAAGAVGCYRRQSGAPEQDMSLEMDSGFACRDDGRFRIPIWAPEGWSGLTLHVESAAGFLHQETRRLEHATVVDLGDLFLEPACVLDFRVLDPAGTPIPGALGLIAGSICYEERVMTGVDGLGTVPFAPCGPSQLRLVAAGFEECVVPALAGVPVEVMLEPLATLSVLWNRGPEDSVLVTSAAPAFVWDTLGWEGAALQKALGADLPSVRNPPVGEDGHWEYLFVMPRGDELRLVGLVADVPLTLELRGADARVRAITTIAVEAGEHRSLELEEQQPEDQRPEPQIRMRSSKR